MERGLDLLLYAYRDIVSMESRIAIGNVHFQISQQFFRESFNEDDI